MKLIFEFKRWKFQNILATTVKLLRSRKGAGHPHDSVGESGQVEEVQVQMEEVEVEEVRVKEAEEAELQQVVLLNEEEKEDVQVGQVQDLQLLQLVAVVSIPILGAHYLENYYSLWQSDLFSSCCQSNQMYEVFVSLTDTC